jgi:hypothetical protein
MNKGTNAFKQTIKDYLEKRGSKDPLFARIVMKPNKNMDDCVQYILNTVQKSGCNGFTDDEVYNMAIHYFDEDNIDIGHSMRDMQVVVNHKVELTAKEKEEARERAINELVAETKRKLKIDPNKKDDKKKEDKPAAPVAGMLSFS